MQGSNKNWRKNIWTKNRNVHAAEVLRRLDEIGAIKLDVLVSKASEIQGVAGVSSDDETMGFVIPSILKLARV